MTKLEIEEKYRKEAERIVKECWGVGLTCPIVFVDREWRRMNACFQVYYETGDCEIRLNHRRHVEYGFEKYVETLKHELVHWYLWSIGEPFDDGAEEFVRECKRIGASFSGTLKAKRALNSYEQKVGGETFEGGR